MAWSRLGLSHVCASPGLLDSSLQSPGQEKHFAILYTSFRDLDTVVCIHLVEEIMADLVRFSALFIILCSSTGILREPPFFARERETFWYLFCPRTPHGSRVSLIGEEEEEERKKENDNIMAGNLFYTVK